jgi:hypothetical protein
VPEDDISAHFQRSSSVLMDPWASASPQRMLYRNGREF